MPKQSKAKLSVLIFRSIMVLFLIVVYVAARWLIGPEVANQLKYNKVQFYNVHWPLPFLYALISVDMLAVTLQWRGRSHISGECLLVL